MPTAHDIRKEISQRIITALEEGVTPWRQPWRVSENAGRAANAISRRPYSGINVMLLAIHSMRFQHRSRWYGTFEQWRAMGGTVRKRPADLQSGEWGCRIVFYRPVTKSVSDTETGEQHQDSFLLLRTYTVFNVDQVEGNAVDRFRAMEEPDGSCPNFGPADELIAGTGADIRIGGEKAVYHRPTSSGSWPAHTGGDFIEVPQRRRFSLPGAWYETVLHELAHWSEVRLAWDHEKEGYPAGELVAELTATLVASELRIPQGESLENHAAYLAFWLSAMKADPSFIFRVSSQASKVCDFLLSHRLPEFATSTRTAT